MNRIKITLILFSLFVFACEDEVGLQEGALTKNTWGKRIVLRYPALGYWSENSCPSGAAYKFNADGSYTESNYCDDIHLTGKWEWLKKDEQVQLETYFNDIYQRTFVITVLTVNDTILHTRVIEKGESENDYYEFIQRPRYK